MSMAGKTRDDRRIEASVRALKAMTEPPAPKADGRRKALELLGQRMDARNRGWDAEEENFRGIVASTLGAGDWSKFTSLLGSRPRGLDLAEAGGRPMAARYDSALTTDDNAAHWAMADGLAADAAANPMIRYVLRNRARYEVANNCYAFGVGLTIANDFVGTGPRLHLTTDDDALNEEVEEKFRAWTQAVNLPEKLRTMRLARRQDGEAFALLISNPGLDHPVKMDLRLIEADQVRFVDLSLLMVPSVDGIRFDDFGNPVSYHVLRVHPGFWSYATGYVGFPWEYDVWPARFVIHWFRKTRPGQHRGVPEILPALPLYATLRRYTQATLDAAETAADVGVLLSTEASAEYTDPDGDAVPNRSFNGFSTVPFSRRMFVALPQGYKADQMTPKHPTQTYEAFKREVAGEIGRCENVSRNVVLMDSSDASFASGALDYRITYRNYDIERADANVGILDRIFRAWLAEAALIEPSKGSWYLPQELRRVDSVPPHSWHWDSNEIGDPLKLANAKAELLANGLTSIPELYSARGQNWLKAFALAARGYGITVEEFQALVRDRIFSLRRAPAMPPEEQIIENAPPDRKGAKVPATTEEEET